jgi:hypothetical protein
MRNFENVNLDREMYSQGNLSDILEHPDYPIVVLATEESTWGGYSYTYCSSIGFGVGEILDCAAICNDEYIYTDRDEFFEAMSEYLFEEYPDMPEEELDKLIESKVAEYNPYWKDVICLWVGN